MRGVATLEGEGDDIRVGQIGEIEGAEHCGKYVRLTPQSSRVLAPVPAPGELSTMVETEVEARLAERAAEGGAEKRAYVRTVFEEIAPRYDLLNHLLSLNIDKMWRRRALRALEWERRPAGVYLDLCAGTLDVAAELSARRGFGGFIVGADFAIAMLRAGSGKAPREVVAPVGADAQQLPLADASMDGATVAFGIRNVASLDVALREVHRVLAPGARFVILEFTTPRSFLVRTFYHFYFHQVLPLIGGLISGHRSAYQYLPKSVAHFPSEPELARRMTEAGFSNVRFETLTLGIAAIHVGEKPNG
ncbi:MAG: bifunctional demethylmenaquinone methyltransferase/2-methoxy-6-polyprenyl-1,4-benzoquinol methylase UbiE [Gemmatimonadota bacterium]